MSISIIKDHRQYEFITSQQFKTTLKITIKYDNTKEGVFFVPMEDKLTDFDVIDSKGRQLPQLSARELENRFKITPSEIRSQNTMGDDTFTQIPVLLLPSTSEFEVLTITYVSAIDPKKYAVSQYSPNMKMIFGFNIIPSEFSINSAKYVIDKHPYSLDIVFKPDDDYKINDDVEIHVDPAGDSQIIKPKKKIPNLLAFHIDNMDFESRVTGKITVALSQATTNAALAVSLAAIAIPLLLITSQIVIGKLFIPTLEILGGVIAVLIGSRIWIVRDKYMMCRL